MPRKDGSRELRDRLRYGAHSVRPGSRFVETIREALRADGVRGGSKRHRVLYMDENQASSTEGAVIELAACGTKASEVRRLRDAYTRAFNDLIAFLYGSEAPALAPMIREETAINGTQDCDAIEVLTDGSLSDLERLYESTRQQRDVSDRLMLAISDRVTQLRSRSA